MGLEGAEAAAAPFSLPGASWSFAGTGCSPGHALLLGAAGDVTGRWKRFNPHQSSAWC